MMGPDHYGPLQYYLLENIVPDYFQVRVLPKKMGAALKGPS